MFNTKTASDPAMSAASVEASASANDRRYGHGVLHVRGGKPLQGKVRVRGAKNTLPKNMVAALLTDGDTRLHNVSQVRDVTIMAEMIQSMGGQVDNDEAAATLRIHPNGIRPLSTEEAARYNGLSRIPILLCGPMLHRFREAFIPSLGGCNIGDRSINFHLQSLQAMGAKLSSDSTGTTLSAPKGLRGAKIHLDYPSVGATEQVILSAVLARGETELVGAAVEPEIMDLICQLQKMGAIITVDTDRVIRIEGVPSLKGCQHTALPDRLESASWACAALATDGRIEVEGARQLEMMAFLNLFRRAGGGFDVTDSGITFFRDSPELRPVIFETQPHPGFMTDWQQPMVCALTQAHGVSVLHETVYEGRLGYIEQLNQMGARIQTQRDCIGSRCRFGRLNHVHSALIVGPTPLKGTRITIPDLRAGFSYVIAALCASGQSEVHNIALINRGYDDFSEKMQALGADFQLDGVI